MPCNKKLCYFIYQAKDTTEPSFWYVAKHKTAWDLYKTLCRAYDLNPSSPVKHFNIRIYAEDKYDSSYQEPGDT